MLILALVLPVYAAPVLREQDILDLVTNEVVLRLQVPRRDVEVEWQDLQPSSLVSGLPEGRISYQIATGVRLGGRGNVPVTILVDGRKFRTIFPKIEGRVFPMVLVARNRIGRGGMANESDLIVRRMAIGNVNVASLTDPAQVLGTEATRDIAPGTVLQAQMFRMMPMVKAGEEVTVTVRAGGLTIVTTGVARGAGALGQVIRVQNRETKSDFLARVTGPNQVEIRMEE